LRWAETTVGAVTRIRSASDRRRIIAGDYRRTRAPRKGRGRLYNRALRPLASRPSPSEVPMKRRPRVVVTRKLPDVVETRRMELFDCQLNLEDRALDAAALAEAARGAEVLVPTVTDHIDAAVIDAAGPQFKLIASFGTGIDHVDLDAAKAKGITVTNTPGVLT